MADVEQWRSEVQEEAQTGMDINGGTVVAHIMEVESSVGELRVSNKFRNENGNLQKEPHQSELGDVNGHFEISSSQVQEELHLSIVSPGQVQCNTYAPGINSIQNEKSLSDALKLKSFQRMEFSSIGYPTGDGMALFDGRKRPHEDSVDASNKRERITTHKKVIENHHLQTESSSAVCGFQSNNNSEGDYDWFQAESLRSLRVVATTTDDSIELNPKIAEEKYVPNWPIANKDTVVAPNLAKLFVYNLSTPTDYLRYRSMGDSDFSDLAMVNQAESNLITSEFHRRWVEAVVEMNKLKYQHKHEIAELHNQFSSVTKVVSTEATTDETSELDEKQNKTYAELAADNARLLAAEREWQEKVANLNKALSEIQDTIMHDVEVHVKEVHSLRDTVATLEQQKLWLLTTGVQLLSHKIRTSPEMIAAVAAVSNATNLCGFVKGIQAGYHYALEAKITMESVPDLPQNVEQNLNLAISEFDNLLVPFVAILAAHVESPFEEIQALLQAPTPAPNA